MEEKGLRMREVKQQGRNLAGMSTRNINKPATELATLESVNVSQQHNGNDLAVLTFLLLR